MKTEIVEAENILIAESVQDLEIKKSALNSKIKSLDKSTPFTDSLNRSFYGGKVGFMNKKDNARKSRELEKYVNSCNTERAINAQILSIDRKLKKLSTGNYLLRKNSLIVDSYALLNEKLGGINKMILSGKIKGKTATPEEISILKEMLKETKRSIKQREKLYK